MAVTRTEITILIS
jgi:ammonium transporter Rh